MRLWIGYIQKMFYYYIFQEDYHNPSNISLRETSCLSVKYSKLHQNSSDEVVQTAPVVKNTESLSAGRRKKSICFDRIFPRLSKGL